MFDENTNLNEEKIAENKEIEEENAPVLENSQATSQNNDFSEKQITPPAFVPPQQVYTVPVLTKEKYEKMQIKRLGLVAGLSFLVLSGIMWMFNNITVVLLKLFLSDTDKVNSLLSEPALMQVQQILFSVIMFTLPFIFIYKFFGFRISDLISFKLPKGKNNFYLFLLGISFCSFANIAAARLEQIFDRAGINYEVDFGESPEGVFGFLLSFIATAIVPALVEEFACRGILLGSLKKYGEGFAIMASSLLFGLMHSNFEQIPFAFLVGLVLGYITIKSGSIWVAILVHAFNNSISIIYTYLLSGLSGVAQNISYIIFLILCMLAGLFAMVKLSKQENMLNFSENETKSTFSQKIRCFLLSPTVIIYSSICILEAFSIFF